MRRSWLRSSRALPVINTLGVGLALAGSAAGLIGRLFSITASDPRLDPGGAIAVPTFVLGALWAWGLRWKGGIGGFRVGWLASVPLASLNAGLSYWAVLGERAGGGSALVAILAGATYGMIIWAPALVATLVCFGVPIAWAERAAARGLMGEERGEAVVGLATAAVGVLGLVVHIDRITFAASLAGLLAGCVAVVIAVARDLRRRRFVSEVLGGRVSGFRVDETPRGRALVRVATDGGAYRVGSIDTESFPLEVLPEARGVAERTSRTTARTTAR